MFCRTPDHTGDGLSTGVISWLLDWAPIALVPPALANVSFIPSFSFLFSALLPFRGMRRQYVVGTAQHSCDTVLSRAADVGLWVLIW